VKRPKAPVAALRVSQANVEQVLGISPRLYLEHVRVFRAAGGHVVEVGRARLVEPVAFLTWLDRGGDDPANDVPAAPGGADSVLGELGLRRTGSTG
jgi:hypothetical protein